MSPISTQNIAMYTQKSPIYYIIKRALYLLNRARNLLKRSLRQLKRALCLLKRALYPLASQATCSTLCDSREPFKRNLFQKAMFSLKRAQYTRMSDIHSPRNPLALLGVTRRSATTDPYVVATICRLLKIIGLFCKRAL